MTVPYAMNRLASLANLRLPSHLYVAAFLEEMHHVLDSDSNTYIWIDKQCNVVRLYNEHHSKQFLQAFHHFLSTADNIALVKLQSWITQLNQPQTLDSTTPSTIATELLYQDTFISAGFETNLCLPVLSADGLEKNGLLICHRKTKAKSFSNKEIRQAQQISTQLGIGVNSRNTSINGHLETWKEGIFILNNTGIVHGLCQAAENILSCANQKDGVRPLESHSANDFANGTLHQQLLLRQLSSKQPRNDGVLSSHNQWGHFSYHSFHVSDEIGHRQPQWCINIKWHVPFQLIIFQNVKHVELTPRQESVALLYSLGWDPKDIARHLNISFYTVKEHIKNIFNKLEVHSRHNLVHTLISAEAQAVQL